MIRRPSKISLKKQGVLIRFFIAGGSARAVAELLRMNRHTVRLYFQKLRERIAVEMDARFNALPEHLRERFQRFEGDAEYDRSTVGVCNVVPVFGIIEYEHNVFTVAVPSEIREANSSQPQRRRWARAPVFADDRIVVRSLRGPSVGVTLQRLQKPELKQSHLFSAAADLLIKRARVRLQYCRGLPCDHFHLFLRECEFLVSERSGHERLLAQWMGLENLPMASLSQYDLNRVQGRARRPKSSKRISKRPRERTIVRTTV